MLEDVYYSTVEPIFGVGKCSKNDDTKKIKVDQFYSCLTELCNYLEF